MAKRVAIVGVGCAEIRTTTPGVSYKELMFAAATRAYTDAGVDPRSEVDSFVCVSEDFWEGTSIFDEYVPDQLGAALRPVHTVCADGMYALACAVMMIRSGVARVVAVEGHSKFSDMRTPTHIHNLAFDPVYNRPLAAHPHFVAGLEMTRFLHETGNTPAQCALVVSKNRRNALANPLACYAANISPGDVLASRPVFSPLTELDISGPADGGFVMILAAEEVVPDLAGQPVWIKGIGWCSDSPSLENRDWARADYARLAAEQAYAQAGIVNPAREVDLAEIDDSFSYKELQHMEALRLCRKGEAGILVEEGATLPDGELPVNVSGGSLGVGHLLEATGLHKVYELVRQLRGVAGERQVVGARTAIAQCWRGIPTTSGAVLVLSAS